MKWNLILLAAVAVLGCAVFYFGSRSETAIRDLRAHMRQSDEASLSRGLELRQGLESLERAVTAPPARPAIADNGVAANGRLAVRGTQLVNEAGVPVQLRGMSSHGLVWFPQYINARALRTLRERGANLFRAAMYSDSGKGGYNESEQARRLSSLYLYIAVENALAADMYAIVDWHLLMDENPLKTVDSAIHFFNEVSSRYADEAGVIYEICNEPNGDATWDDVYAYAERVIPVIRKNAPHAVILVGTPRWSSDLAAAREKPLPYDNVMYAYHMYTGYGDHEFQTLLDAAREAGQPVFVSEWGISREKETGELDVREAHDFIAYMKEHRLSWAYWSLSNTDEDFSVIRKDVAKLSGWEEADLTPAGKVVFAALAE